jgi:hypothetical protein
MVEGASCCRDGRTSLLAESSELATTKGLLGRVALVIPADRSIVVVLALSSESAEVVPVLVERRKIEQRVTP